MVHRIHQLSVDVRACPCVRRLGIDNIYRTPSAVRGPPIVLISVHALDFGRFFFPRGSLGSGGGAGAGFACQEE